MQHKTRKFWLQAARACAFVSILVIILFVFRANIGFLCVFVLFFVLFCFVLFVGCFFSIATQYFLALQRRQRRQGEVQRICVGGERVLC